LLWDNAIVSNGDKGEIIEVPLILQKNITTSANLKIKDYHRLLFMKGENNTYDTKYIQVFTADSTYNNLDKEFNYYSIKDNFNGSIYVLNGKAKSGTSLKFKKGEKITPNFTAKESDQAEVNCLYLGWWHEDGSFSPIIELGCFGSGGGDEYLGNTTGGNTTGGYGGSGNGSSTTNTEAVDVSDVIEDKIDDTKLDPCTKEILNKLKGLTQCDIAGIFTKLGGNSEIYTLTFEIANNNGNPASTSNPVSNYYKTVIDNDFLYGIDGTGVNKPPTNLAIAAVMIHEMVHTYFFSLYNDKLNNGITNALDEFDLLYKKYVARNYVGADDAQHAQIWKSFINTMASSLQEYHTGDSANPSQFYQDIILGTLMTTNTFLEKYPKNSVEYNRIENNYVTEKNNGSNDPNYKPKGTLCQ
jgi:hypothetical protein